MIKARLLLSSSLVLVRGVLRTMVVMKNSKEILKFMYNVV